MLKKWAFKTANSKPNHTKILNTHTQNNGVITSLKIANEVIEVEVVSNVVEVNKKLQKFPNIDTSIYSTHRFFYGYLVST